MTDPLVTVIITTYERPDLVKRAIRSVLDQSYDNVELIVVEDASDSGVDEWLAERGHNDVTYIRHETNRGAVAARNTGLEAMEGEYVAFLDDDDLYKPRFVERMIETVESLSPEERSDLGVAYAALEIRRPDGSVISVAEPENDGDLKESIRRHGTSTLDSSMFFPISVMEDVGGWDESLPTGNVHDMWMELATRGYRAVAVDEPLVVMFRDDRERMTTDTQLRIDGIRQYVEKWRPTYREWFGPEAGERYAERYYARVIMRLAGEKLVEGQVREAWQAARAVADYCDDRSYAARVFVRATVEEGVKDAFPPAVVRLLKRVERTLS